MEAITAAMTKGRDDCGLRDMGRSWIRIVGATGRLALDLHAATHEHGRSEAADPEYAP
ncbi:hypothetical protein [Paraburkholderia strydomiana]|uniref:hypothetical protein n=1 Tax=Paraburkholderia strydomiana TaxID=1245417 RepID=UPI0038BCFACC